MNTQNLKEKFDAFRNHPATVKATEIGKQALTAVAVGLTIKVVTFVVVAGTTALISEINNQVNKTTD
jgi:hypothetical protein